MDILNLNTNSTSGSSVGPVANDTATSSAKDAARSSTDQSVIVSLSAQGQKLSRTAASTQAAPAQANRNNVGVPPPENAEAKPKEAAKSPGIQLLQGESKRGHINTYA